jgi:hypothetical protein
MAKVRARVTGTRKLYIHNTLENSAYFLKNTIDRKIEEDSRAGIAFDYMNLGVLLAFDFEAKLNFMGVRYVKPWDERQRWKCKADRVFKALGIERDWVKRPYSSLKSMKTLRDSIAHGKPLEGAVDEEATGEEEDILKGKYLAQPWEKLATHDEVMQAYEDTDIVWKEMVEKSGIDVMGTIDEVNLTISVIERLK